MLPEVGLPGDPEKREKVLNNLRLQWDTIDEESLPLPKNINDKAEVRYKRKKQMVIH